MVLITTRKGDALIAFHEGKALDITERDRAIPMPLALIVAKYAGKVVFVFNTWRKVWELPGGMIDEGESPHETAIRELAEETGQHTSQVDYVGWMKLQLKPDDRLELAVLYHCELETLQPFQANNEASQMILWDLESPIEGDVAEIDLYLAKLIK